MLVNNPGSVELTFALGSEFGKRVRLSITLWKKVCDSSWAPVNGRYVLVSVFQSIIGVSYKQLVKF